MPLFEKGNKESGNPRQAYVKFRKMMLREAEADDNFLEVVRTVFNQAKMGESNAQKMVLEYCMGKPTQQIDVEGGETAPTILLLPANGRSVDLPEISTEDLRRIDNSEVIDVEFTQQGNPTSDIPGSMPPEPAAAEGHIDTESASAQLEQQPA